MFIPFSVGGDIFNGVWPSCSSSGRHVLKEPPARLFPNTGRNKISNICSALIVLSLWRSATRLNYSNTRNI